MNLLTSNCFSIDGNVKLLIIMLLAIISITFSCLQFSICIRGNQAYKNGNLSKAEEFYTQGIKSAPPGETAGCCIKPLLLCYSNRAATKISLGRLREAIEDCLIAANIDSHFLKVYMRAAK